MSSRSGAVVVAVLLVVASGSVVAAPAADAGSAAVGDGHALLQDGNETDGNETDGNVTDGEQANVTFEDQFVGENGTVEVASVTVPEGGFVAIHSGEMLDDANETVESVIGVSEYLEAGTHENVTVQLYGNVSGANFTVDQLNESETLFAMPHRDSNGNESFDFVATNGTEDGPYVNADREPVTDQAFVSVEEEDEAADNATGDNVTADDETNVTEPEDDDANVTDDSTNVTADGTNVTSSGTNVTADDETNVTDDDDETNVTDDNVAEASVLFGNQTSDGTEVVIPQVTVPDGGFVAVHDESWFENETTASVVGASEYLEPGTHENVTVRLYANVSGANFTVDRLNESENLLAMPHRDTNGNESFDFVATNGTEDGPYVGADGEPILNVGNVVVEAENVTAEPANDTVTNETSANETTVNESATSETGESLGG